MKKKIIIISTITGSLLIILGLFLFFNINNKEETKDFKYTPITYEVCDNNSCIYLLGSIHVGNSKVTKFNDEIIDLYNKSEYLAVELDINKVNIDYTKFIANPNETLNDLLTEELQKDLKEILNEKSILSYEQLNFFKIGYVANYLSLLPVMELNLSNSGVDEYFLSKAHKENKKIIELETYEEQLSLLLDFSKEFYINQIKTIVLNYDDTKTSMENLYEAYIKADKTKLEELLNEEETINTEEEREYQNRIIYDRNKNMSNKVEEFLNEDKEVLMIVGLAHVIGNDGIIDILEEKNYKIKLIKQK